jgi:hypothetical protein
MKTMFHFGAVIVLLGLFVLNPGLVHAAGGTTITVNTNEGNGVVDGNCSLPEAFLAANNGAATVDCPFSGSGTPYTIKFNIGGGGAQTITLANQMAAAVPLVIDGATQPGYSGVPLIRVDGGNSVAWGLVFNPGSAGSFVKDLMITRFTSAQVAIGGGVAGKPVTLFGNYLGTDGTTALGGSTGLWIQNGNYVQAGGTSAADRNIISGNSSANVEIFDSSSHNVIQGNYIGLNANGNASISGNADGIQVIAPNNQFIGNVVSGNTSYGIYANGNSNIFESNYVGTNASGTSAVANGDGVYIYGGDGNQVGGTGAGLGNLISGNTYIGLGIVSTATNTKVFGNRIGSDKNGTGSIPNINDAIYLNNTPADIEGNLISGNTADGILLDNAGTTGSTIVGNKIGVSLTGSSLSNTTGVEFEDGASGRVAQNYIGDNASYSVYVGPTSTVASGSNNNCFINNSAFGLTDANTTAAPAPFSSNWWGSASGPTDPVGNPGGTGDKVNPTSGNIDYSSWLTSPAAACAPKASLSSPSLNFGFQKAGTPSSIHSITLTNTGMAALNFASITPPSRFSLDSSSTCHTGTPVAVNATCTLAIKFSPIALGNVSGNVVIASDAFNTPANIAVSGTGIGPQLLKDADFEGTAGKQPAFWTLSGINTKTDFLDCGVHHSGLCSLKLVGNGIQKTVYQTVITSGGAGKPYAFNLSSQAGGVPAGATYMAQVLFYNGGTLTGSKTLTFSKSASGFQTLSGSFTTTGTYTKIVFKIIFKAAAGTVWFDTAGLYQG